MSVQALTTLLGTVYQGGDGEMKQLGEHAHGATSTPSELPDRLVLRIGSSAGEAAGSTENAGSHESGTQEVPLSVRHACTQHALPALLRALQDYTTDIRGDVGSMCGAFVVGPSLWASRFAPDSPSRLSVLQSV